MSTVRDTIRMSLMMIGKLAEGESPSAETFADSLVVFNEMIETFSTENLMIYANVDQVFTWPANQASRTLGPSGDFVGVRPLMVEDSSYFVDNLISYPLVMLNQQMYNDIALKSAQSTYPQYMFTNYEFPNIRMYVFPVPTKALQFHLISNQLLNSVNTLDTNVTLPQGYAEMLRYNLALRLSSMFGISPPPVVARMADTTKSKVKRINQSQDVMAMPSELRGKNFGRFNIFSGDYR